MSRLKFLKVSLLAIVVFILISIIEPDFEGMAEARQFHASLNKGDIKIVAIQDYGRSDYIKGVRLAVDEINNSDNKLLGRDIELSIINEGKDFNESKPIINRIAGDPKVTAVLGHRKSSIAIPASVVYEKSQLVFLPSFSTSKMLTGHNFQYVFRMAPNNETMAKQLASVAHILGYKKVVILYARDDLSRELAFVFEEASLNKGIQPIKRASFFEKDTNFRGIISQFTNEPFDAIFIASGSDSAGRLTSQLREMGIDKPILGSDSLNKSGYVAAAGRAADKTILPSLYHGDESNSLKNEFTKGYIQKFNKQPDYNAAQGYDSMKLLATAINRAGSTSPALVSSTLRFMPSWVGITGIHSFDHSGEIQGKKYYFQTWREGELQQLPAVHSSYLLDRFQQSLSTDHEHTDFNTQFTKRMHEDDHKTYLLDLAHEILGFKKIGIIFENTDTGRKNSGHNLLTELAKRKDIEIVGCEVPFSLMNKAETEDAMVDCYGKLSLSTNAILVSPLLGVNQTLIKRLNAGLAFFKIPTISLDVRNEANNVTLSLTRRTDIDKFSIAVFNGLLNEQKIHEFTEKLIGMPDIKVNLRSLQSIGQNDTPVLLLSPDVFLHDDTSFSANGKI